MNRIVAVNSNCYHGYPLTDAIDGIAKAGFHYIELTATKGWTEHVFPTMSLRELWDVKEQLALAGLKPFAMSGHTNLMDRARIADFRANIRLAAFMGCDYILSSIGEAHLEDKAVVSNEAVAEHIRGLLPYLEEHSMKLGLEVHGEHGTGRILKEIALLVDSPLVGVNYDTANALFFGDVDLAEDFAYSLDCVNYLHLKDKAGARTEWNFPALGRGTIDFPMIVRMLKQAGNDAPFSIEIEFTKDGPKDLAEINRAVQDSYLYLQSIGVTV